MIVLYSNATGLKSAFHDTADMIDYLEDYRIIDRKESEQAIVYEIVWLGSGRSALNYIVIDKTETEAINLIEARYSH